MSSRAGALVLALVLLAGCAIRPPAPGAFTFAVVGDLGYSDKEEAIFLETMRRIDATAPAFTVHVGDFKGGQKCSDDFYRLRRAQLDASEAPLLLTPGDNDWTDCRREYMGAMDPIERLGAVRRIFYPDGQSMGRRRITTDAQDECVVPQITGCGCAAHPENRQWRHGRFHFVALNIPGSNNNVGFDAANDEEARCRNGANAAWLERAARAAEDSAVRALVVIIHANPWDAQPKHRHVYDGFLTGMAALPARLLKPILFIHGDSHRQRVAPFLDKAGVVVEGITRLETFGTPFIGWVQVTADPGRPEPFEIVPRLVSFSGG